MPDVSPARPASSGFGSNEIVFFRPRLVVPGIFGPTIDEVYLMISVSGGKRTPNSDDGSLRAWWMGGGGWRENVVNIDYIV